MFHHGSADALACLAGISAKQVQIILEDLRQEVERQSANGNHGTITASHMPASGSYQPPTPALTLGPPCTSVSTLPSLTPRLQLQCFVACCTACQLYYNNRQQCRWCIAGYAMLLTTAGKIPAVMAATRLQEDADSQTQVRLLLSHLEHLCSQSEMSWYVSRC